MTARRSLLGMAAAAAVAPVLSATAAPAVVGAVPQPDAELIRLAAAHATRSAEMRALTDRWCDLDEPPEVTARIRVLVERGHKIAEQMADLDATTLDGFKAKARVLLYYTLSWANGSPIWNGHNELLGWSLAMDLTGGTEWEA